MLTESRAHNDRKIGELQKRVARHEGIHRTILSSLIEADSWQSKRPTDFGHHPERGVNQPKISQNPLWNLPLKYAKRPQNTNAEE